MKNKKIKRYLDGLFLLTLSISNVNGSENQKMTIPGVRLEPYLKIDGLEVNASRTNTKDMIVQEELIKIMNILIFGETGFSEKELIQNNIQRWCSYGLKQCQSLMAKCKDLFKKIIMTSELSEPEKRMYERGEKIADILEYHFKILIKVRNKIAEMEKLPLKQLQEEEDPNFYAAWDSEYCKKNFLEKLEDLENLLDFQSLHDFFRNGNGNGSLFYAPYEALREYEQSFRDEINMLRADPFFGIDDFTFEMADSPMESTLKSVSENPTQYLWSVLTK